MFPLTQRIVFFGTPAFATDTLRMLVESGRTVVCAVTQPDKIGGRGNQVLQPAVKICAKQLNIPVVQPEKLRTKNFLGFLSEQSADIFVVAAYGRILSEPLISMPKYILNVHASLLPRWRGAAPIARAIEAGDSVAGVSIMKIVKELDAGDYMLQDSLAIGEDETTGELTDRLAQIGARAMLKALDLIDQQKEFFHKQDESQVTYAKPIEKEEARIDWNKPSKRVHNHIRAMQPMPGAFTMDGNLRIKVHATKHVQIDRDVSAPGSLFVKDGRLLIATQDAWLEATELQREGKGRQATQVFLQGYDALDKRWI